MRLSMRDGLLRRWVHVCNPSTVKQQGGFHLAVQLQSIVKHQITPFRMSIRLQPLAFSFVAASFIAAAPPKLPAVPPGPIAQKKELLFSDDFQGAEPAKLSHKVVPTFTVENGALKGTQLRDQDVPAANGQPAIK